MIKVDYHTHNSRCGHAQGTIEEYVKTAVSRGLTDIGISDHSPVYWLDGNDPMPQQAMAKDELDVYVDEVLSLKERYAGQITVRLGLEVDYIEDMEAFYTETLAKYPFDYLIGSVHHVFGEHVYHARRWDSKPDPLKVYTEYYRLLEKSARSGMFDILAHSTAILAYAPRPFPAELEPLQDAALDAISESDVVVEINTSGYRKMREPFPSARMIARIAALNIPLTFSSDSHRPDEVAYNRDQVEMLLITNGVTELATFENRTRIMMPLVVEPVIL